MYHDLRDLHSFPTRRSSDLFVISRTASMPCMKNCFASEFSNIAFAIVTATSTSTTRSEEHTSELQSRPHLVCRLLLEKKNYRFAHHDPNLFYEHLDDKPCHI